MANQSHGSNLWHEPAGSGTVPTAAPMVLIDDAGAWVHTQADVGDGSALDPGDGSRTIFDRDSEYFAVADGVGGFVLSVTGPAAAVLTDDGAGGLTLVAVGTGVVQAGRFLPDSRGDVYPIRFSAAELQFLSTRGITQSY